MIIIRQPRARSAGPGRTGEAVRLLVCCLLFIGVLARGLIPAGYMPERDVHSGDISVAMCSGAGEMQTIHLGPTEAPPKGKTVGQHCPFAGLSASLLPQPGPAWKPQSASPGQIAPVRNASFSARKLRGRPTRHQPDHRNLPERTSGATRPRIFRAAVMAAHTGKNHHVDHPIRPLGHDRDHSLSDRAILRRQSSCRHCLGRQHFCLQRLWESHTARGGHRACRAGHLQRGRGDRHAHRGGSAPVIRGSGRISMHSHCRFIAGPTCDAPSRYSFPADRRACSPSMACISFCTAFKARSSAAFSSP